MARQFNPTVRKDTARRYLHIETELGIVNIYYGLHDEAGQRVERVEMLPNAYAGEPPVTVEGGRFVEQTIAAMFTPREGD